jgi:hypothetical protein
LHSNPEFETWFYSVCRNKISVIPLITLNNIFVTIASPVTNTPEHEVISGNLSLFVRAKAAKVPAPPLLRCRDSFPDRVATIADFR